MHVYRKNFFTRAEVRGLIWLRPSRWALYILNTIGFSKKAGEFMLEFTLDVRKIDCLQSN